MDNSGKIWFTDTPGDQIGYIDLATKEITTKEIPNLAQSRYQIHQYSFKQILMEIFGLQL